MRNTRVTARRRAAVRLARGARFLLALTLLAPAVAPAAGARAQALAEAPATADVVARHAAAIGARDVLRDTRSLLIEGSVHAFGLTGRMESIVAGPGNIVQSLDLGPISQKTGLAGGEDAWGVDANGKVRTLEGDERRALVTEAWLASFAYVALDDVAVVAGPDTLRLVVAPPGGHARILTLDPATDRVVYSVEAQDTDSLTTIYEDYRAVDGLMLPFRARQTTGDPTYDLVIDVDRVERNVAIDAARFARPVSDASDVRYAGESAAGAGSDAAGPGIRRAENIPLTMFGAHVFASVRVNGRGPYSMFLDTGAGASCIDETLARELGLAREGAIEAKGVTGSATVSTVQVDSLRVGPATLLSQRLVTLPLSGLPGGEDGRYSGILGYDFFSRFVVRLDYAAKTLSLYDPRGWEPPPNATVLPISLEGNVPSVQGTVDGRLEGLFRIDTGSGSELDLHGPFVADNRLLATARRVAHRPMAGIGGVSLGAVSRLESFALGPYVVRDPIVGLSEMSEGAFATKRSAGNVGGGILRRFTITFDYEHGRMVLEPNDRLGEREAFDRSGLACWTERGVRRAAHVDEGSPAWKAGLREGDRIVAVNGRASAEWDDIELSQALQSKPGTLVSVRYERDGEARSVRFRLEEIL